MSLLDEIKSKLECIDPAARANLVEKMTPLAQKMRFIPLEGPQTEAYISKADVLLYGGQAGGGKGLALDTLLPCPSGFVAMGDVKAGDVLYDQDGHLTTVTAVSDINHRPCFEVEFDDGNKIIADDVHNWLTLSDKDRDQIIRLKPEWRERRKVARPSRAVVESQKPWASQSITLINQQRVHEYMAPPVPAIRTTAEIASSVKVKAGRLNHSVDVCGAIDGPELALPIEPYLFGLWLGDGFSKAGTIGMLADDWGEILPHVSLPIKWRKVETGPLGKRQFDVVFFEGLPMALKALGVRSNKHIPVQYLRSGVEQRRELLRGLMDTDGCCAVGGKMEIALSNQRLAEDVAELICSLGVKTRISVKRLSEKNPNWNDSHRMTFSSEVPLFKLSRKRERQKDAVTDRVRRRFIKAVRPILSVPTKCIAVDSPSRTYLVGRSFIPTHNSYLLMGLSSQEHTRSIIFRRESSQTDGLEEAGKAIIGATANFNGTDKEWKWSNGRSVKLAGMQLPDDWNKHAGRERDMFGFDEAGEFLRQQVASLLGWNRGPDGQRCRVVLASNPPRSSDGYWMTEWFAPWLDLQYHNPAAPGDLRYAHLIEASPIWVDGPDCLSSDGEKPLSFTFIPAKLSDNPYRDTPEYRSKLESLPEPLRSQLKFGDFAAGTIDGINQVIPTDWVKQAQERWKPQRPVGVPMCAIGVDVAQGGTDQTVLATRFDGWYMPIEAIPGIDTPSGAEVAGKVLARRHDGAKVIVDLGGGWGGDALAHLTGNGVDAVGYMGVKDSVKRTRDNQLRFSNVRTEAYWRFREALDPYTQEGSPIQLPHDRELLADLTAPTYETKSGKGGMIIHLEAKEKLVKRLGRSPDKGDAVVMAWWSGEKAISDAMNWKQSPKNFNRTPKVLMGRQAARRK